MSKQNQLLKFAILAAMLPSGHALAAAAADTSGGLEEVIVTAEKRSVSSQKVASAVTAVTGEMMVDRGITDLRGIASLAPSVRFVTETNAAQQFVRGVGSNLDFAWVPEAISYNVNGVPITRFASLTTMFDVERVELLPGPQGTLYGGNAGGGVVNLTSKRPVHGTEANVTVEIGNYGRLMTTLVGNVALGDHWSARAALNLSRHDGYMKAGTEEIDDEKSVSGRLSALYEANDDFSFYAWANFYRNRARMPTTPFLPLQNPSDPWKVPAFGPPFVIPGLVNYPGLDLASGRGKFNAFMAGAQAEWHLDGMTISYLPSALVYTDHDVRAIAGFRQTFDIGIHAYTQELRATSDTEGPLQWIGGLYWRQNTTEHDYVFGPYLGGAHVPNRDRNLAAYGQATYAFTEATRLTVGGRLSRDQKQADNAWGRFPTCAPPLFCSDGKFVEGRLPFTFDRTWSRFDWKVGVEHDLAEKSMLYATVQTGYNAGTFNPLPATAAFDNLVRPQNLVSYTVGNKNRFNDDRIELNAELYQYDYKNLILQAYNVANGNTAYFNAPKTKITGADLTAKMQLGSDTTLSVGLGLLNARLTEFTNAGNNYAGARLMYSPKLTANVSLRQVFRLSGGQLVGFVSSRHETGYWSGDSFDHVVNSELWQKAYTKSDASLTYEPDSGKWSLGLWAKNLENKAILAAAAPIAPGFGAAFIEPPRTYGLRWQWNY
jgi:iron complex outermembrane recepter protein